MDDMKKAAIKNAFARAGLSLKFMTKPPAMFRASTAGSARDVFFADIGRSKGKAWYNMWPGGDTNRIEVLDANKDFRQVVLMAHEPARKVAVREYDRAKRKLVSREMKVPSVKRKFLLGYDERDLFMAQLPAAAAATTVLDAHRVLFNKSVPKDDYIRQGEWFFVPVDRFKAAELNKPMVAIARKRPISPRGNPHRCDELISYPARELGQMPEMYARGAVTHPDHATIRLKGWHRIYSNTEDRSSNARWID